MKAIAIIGAGRGGLVAARWLKQEGFAPVSMSRGRSLAARRYRRNMFPGQESIRDVPGLFCQLFPDRSQPSEPDGSRALAQKDVGRTFARDALRAFIAQSTHIDVVQEMLPGTE